MNRIVAVITQTQQEMMFGKSEEMRMLLKYLSL